MALIVLVSQIDDHFKYFMTVYLQSQFLFHYFYYHYYLKKRVITS